MSDEVEKCKRQIEFLEGGIRSLQDTIKRVQRENSSLIRNMIQRRELVTLLRNPLPYRDESGVIEFPLHTYGQIMRLAEATADTSDNRAHVMRGEG